MNLTCGPIIYNNVFISLNGEIVKHYEPVRGIVHGKIHNHEFNYNNYSRDYYLDYAKKSTFYKHQDLNEYSKIYSVVKTYSQRNIPIAFNNKILHVMH